MTEAMLQIAFDLYGIMSRTEQLLMQEEWGGLVFCIIAFNCCRVTKRWGKCYVMTRITLYGASERGRLGRRDVFGLITRRYLIK